MTIELREISMLDDKEIYEMIVEIGEGENGFGNSGYNIPFEDFPEHLKKNIDMSKGIGLRPEYVPQTMYWLWVNDKPVGIGKFRHYLNDNLKEYGGHIGYCIRPSQRGKRYGNIILKEILKKAKNIGLREVLLTCYEDNIPSRRVIENNNGVLESISNGKCKYWIRDL